MRELLEEYGMSIVYMLLFLIFIGVFTGILYTVSI